MLAVFCYLVMSARRSVTLTFLYKNINGIFFYDPGLPEAVKVHRLATVITFGGGGRNDNGHYKAVVLNLRKKRRKKKRLSKRPSKVVPL